VLYKGKEGRKEGRKGEKEEKVKSRSHSHPAVPNLDIRIPYWFL